MANYNQISRGTSDSESTMELQKLLNSKGNYNLVVDGKFGPATESALKAYQKANNLDVDGIAGPQTWGALTKAQNTTTTAPTATAPAQNSAKTELTTPTFNPTKSDVAKQKDALVEQHNANRPGDLSFDLQAGWDDIINQITNGEKFSYDLNGDMLYQQYKDQYTTQGKLAMMDTMGQAAAMTGGYGNSYAQTAGQQAYQGYLQQLNDKVPELYQLALDQYNQERQDLYNQYSLYADQYEKAYGEHRDEVTDWKDERDYLTEDARYTNQTEYDHALDLYNIDNTSYWNNKNFDYTKEQDTLDREWDQKLFDYQKEQDVISNDIAYKKIQNENEDDDPKTPDYSDWDAGDWEAYFASIRQSEGKAAAQEELEYFTRNGLIPTNMVTHAASGARGGQMGH